MSAKRPAGWVAAFTVVELLVAILIVGVLAICLVLGAGKLKENSDNVVCLGNVRQLVSSLLAYSSDHNAWLPPPYQALARPNQATVFNSYMINGEPWRLIFPYTTTLDDPNYQVFYCPTNRDPVHGMIKADRANDWKYSSYYYFFPFHKVQGPLNYAPVKLTSLAGETVPLVSDMVKKVPVIPLFHGGRAINVGYSDGSVLHLMTDPNERYYRSVLPGYPAGSVSAAAVTGLSQLFQQSRLEQNQ